MKKYDFKRYGLSIALPGDWEIEQEKNTFSFFDPVDGVGVLQISVYFLNSNKKVLHKKELVEYLKKKGIKDGEIIRDIKTTASTSSITYVHNDDYWEVSIMIKNGSIFFITYNCEVQDQFKEIKKVKKVIESI